MAHAERRLAEARKFGLEAVVHPGERVGTLRDALRAIKGEARARAA